METEKRYKVRHKPSGKFLANRSAFGLSPTGQLFTSRQKVLQALKSRAAYKLPPTDELELVEYDLVEVKVHPLKLKQLKQVDGHASSGLWIISEEGARRL